MNMKKLFLQTIRLGFFLGFLLSPTQNWCALVHPGDFQLYEPAPLHLLLEKPVTTPPSEKPKVPTSSGIDATYAVKNLLSSIMEAFPHLTVQEALSRSALLGIISETDVQLHMYGTYQVQEDPKKPGRTIKVFDTNTSLNKIARLMLDVLSGKLRSTVQESNPFCGLEGAAIARIMQALTTGNDGINNLVKLLKDSTFITTWSDDWDAKMNTPTDDPNQKKEYSLSEFKTKIKDFIKLLETLNKAAKTSTEKAKNVNDLAKIFMTFLCVKDQKQKATGSSHALKEYYTELLGREFVEEQYTQEKLNTIKQALAGKDSSYSIKRDTKGLEDTIAYLSHFGAGDSSFLEAPFSNYITPTKKFSYCAEATIHSIMNSILYNPKKGILDINMLPIELQNHMGQKFKEFIKKYPDPAAPNYYADSLKEWLDLVAGLEGVEYKKGKGADAYEIKSGPENLVRVLNHIFGTTSDSFETFGTAVSNPEKSRKIDFMAEYGGFHFQIEEQGEVTIDARVETISQGVHASFTFKQNSITSLLHNKTFRSWVREFSDYAQEDLYGSIFMNKPGAITLTPLEEAIKNHWNDLVKTMLACGTDPNFKIFSTPLEEAILGHADDIVDALLQYGARVTEEALVTACTAGNLVLVKKFIPILEESGHSLQYASLLLKISESQSPSISLVEFLISKGVTLNGEDSLGKTLLFKAIDQGSLALVEYLVEHGILNDTSTKKTAFQAAIRQAASQATNDVSIVEYLIAHGATLPRSEQTKSFIDSLLLNDNARLIRCLIDTHIITAQLPFDKTNSLLSLAIKTGKFVISQFLIHDTPELSATLLLSVVASDSFTTEQKIELTKSILEKVTDISTAVFEEVRENLAIYEELNEDELGEEDKKEMELQKKQWTELLNLLEQAKTEQSFGLNLTTQEQKCITECVTEAI